MYDTYQALLKTSNQVIQGLIIGVIIASAWTAWSALKKKRNTP